MTTTTTAPASVRARGWVYPLSKAGRRDAISIAPRPTGRMRPLSAPTRIRMVTGRPTARNTTVETAMNPMMSARV
jgi:hypothetical protein